MVYTPGEFPKNYLDPRFFANEAKNLKLTLDVTEQFKIITQSLVGEFQKDVEATSEGFISYVQQGENLSHKDVMQALTGSQNTINTLNQTFQDDLKTLLLHKVGPDYGEAIDHYIQDIQKEIAPFINLDERARTHPDIGTRMPPRSIFEYAQQTLPVSKKPFQNYLNKLNEWEKSFSVGSIQRVLVKDVRSLINQAAKQIPPPTLQGLLVEIHQSIIQPQNMQNIYMRFSGLQEEQANRLFQIFDPSMTAPKFTKMNQIYNEAKEWQADPHLSRADQSLSNAVVKAISVYLGSSDQATSSLQNWGQNVIDTQQPLFNKASHASQEMFIYLTGASPLSQYLHQIEAWGSKFSKMSPQAKFAHQAHLTLKNLVQHTVHPTPLQAVTSLQESLFSGNQDIYQRFPGLSPVQVKTFSKIFGGHLPTPELTQMDKVYLRSMKALQSGTLSAADKTLLTHLSEKAASLGSQDSQLTYLASWVNQITRTPEFLNASKNVQAHVISSAQPGPTIAQKTAIENYQESLSNWESQYQPGTPQYALAEAIKKLLQDLHPATLSALIAAINKQIFDASGNPQDVYMRFPGLTPDQLQSLCDTLTGKKGSMTIPTFTKMDQKFVALQKWLDSPGLSDKDKVLANQVLGEMKNLGSSDSQLAELQSWAATAAATAGSPYANGSNTGQSQFAAITGIPQVTPPPTPSDSGEATGGDTGGDSGLAGLARMMQEAEMQRMAVEFSIENLISMVAQQGKVSVMPSFIQQVANKIIDTSHIHISGPNGPYSPNQTIPPGAPLPTNSWWTLLADDRGAGSLGLQVVANNQSITDPKSQIHLQDALLFDPNATVGGTVSIPYNIAFSPNVNQGAYNVQSYNDGFAFNPSEQYQTASNGSSSYSQVTPYIMVAGAKEDLIYPPTVVTSDDNSVTLEYKTKEGGTMDVPIVRGSPYMTYQYSKTTPYFNSTSTPIDMNSVYAYFYKQVVATVTDPSTQISQQDAAKMGLDTTIGHVDLVQNPNGPPWKGGIQGQVFTYKMVDAGVQTGDTYRLYFSSPVTLNPCNYATETVIPDDVPIPNPNPNNYIHDSTKTPYSTEQVDQYSTTGVATGLEASGPFTGTARLIKIPSAAAEGKGGSTLIQQTLDEINALLSKTPKGDLSQLKNWAEGLLADTNFLQNYPGLTANDFNQFCRLVGFTPTEAETLIAQTWKNRVPMDPNNPNQPLPQYQNWYNLAIHLNQLLAQGETEGQIQQWLQNVVNGKDPQYSPMYKALDPANQQFLQTFSGFTPPALPYPAETDINQALTDAQGVLKQEPADLYTQTENLFDKDAWTIPISGHYTVTGMGKWSYTYTVDTSVNPYSTLNFTNAPPASSGQILIGLLKTDFNYLDGTNVFNSKAYSETIRGELEFVETTNNQVSFYDKDTAITWPDDSLSKLSPADQLSLAEQYIQNVVPNLWLPDRHDNQVTYDMGKDVQNAADVAHALWKLAQLNPSVAALPGFQAALGEAKQVAEAGLDDYLTGGLLEYDKTNGMIISTFGQQGPYVDYSNAYGEDHHFAYGYLIRAAAELMQVDPSWFQDPKYGSQRTQMVNLLVDDVFNVDNNPNFPRMRMYDSYIGIGRATGLVPPAGNGMNEESTAEDYNCIQGIAMWGQATNNQDLANQAATMAERVKNAAQAYWQPNSSTSIYTDPDAPEAAREFAQKVISCGVNWDNAASSANFFTPANGDPNIFTIAIEYITGNSNLVDYKAALAAFNYLINQNDPSGFARLFQQNISLNTPGAVGYFSYISILIPLIAQVSPNAALAILNWFQQANALQPNVYAYDNGCNYGTIYQQILMAKENSTHPDPFSSVAAFQGKLPPLPPKSTGPVYPMDIAKGTALYYLSPWTPPDGIYAQIMPQIDSEVALLKQQGKYSPQALDNWISNTLIPKYPSAGLTVGGVDALYAIYTQMSPSGRKLMQDLSNEVDLLKSQGINSIQALRTWVLQNIVPNIAKNYPNLNAFDIQSFCKVAQLDIHALEGPTPPPPPPPPNALPQLEQNTQQYLNQEQTAYAQFLVDLGISAANAPTTAAGWQALANRSSINATKLAYDIALAQKNGNWQALATKWKLAPGDDATIQKEAQARLNAYGTVMQGLGYQSAILLFTQSLQEIKQLEASGGTVADLKAWADKVNLANYPDLSPQDLKEFTQLQ